MFYPARISASNSPHDQSFFEKSSNFVYSRTKQKFQIHRTQKKLSQYHCKMISEGMRRINLLNSYVFALIFIVACTSLQSNHLSFALQLNNDVMPQQYQHNNILHFEVAEGAPNGTWVGNIRSSDGQPPMLVLPLPQTPENERKAALNINFNTGDLTTNSILDREHRDQYHFIAIVREPFAEIKCTVTVKDVNDNAPMFLMPTPNETNFVIDMPEGQRGIRKALPLAIDYDTPQFGIKEFRIVSGNTPSGMFQLVEHEAPARSTLLQGGAADDTNSAMLGADNPQLLQQLAQQATVLIPSQPVMQAPALASTMNGQASSSSSASPQSLTNNYLPATNYQQQAIASTTLSKFLIDLEVSQPLDRENQSSYQLVVEAIDGGQPPGRLMVTVNVQDINDNDPTFPRKFYECHFREDTHKGTLIYRVQAYDADLDSNGQVSYYIKRYSSSSQTATALNQITNSTSDTNEVSARYSTASSNNNSNNNNNGNKNGNKQRAQTQSTNGAKQARQGANGLESLENTATSSPAAADISSGFNKQRQSYPPDQLFDIDPIKGEIYLVNSLDFETDQVHEIVVEARDHGKPSRSGLTTVKVYVIDIIDDPVPSAMNRVVDERKQMSSANLVAGDSSRVESSTNARLVGSGEYPDVLSQLGSSFYTNLTNMFRQTSSSLLFAIIMLVVLAVSFSVCLVKIRSRQPESDYNDTAGLTLASNSGQSKPSPNHSTSNLEHPGTLDSVHHRHHDHQRRPNGSFGGLDGSMGHFVASSGKMRHHYISDNFYHNPHAESRQRHHSSTSHHMPHDSLAEHQMALGQSARGGTLTMHNHRHHQLMGDHSLDHHHHQFDLNPNHNTTSSLTYAHHHSRTPLLHTSNHHQSSRHLASIHQSGHNKGGTMNSIGTHHSAHHAPSASPATPTSSSHLPPNMHDPSHHHHHHRHHAAADHHNQHLPSLPSMHHHQNGNLPTPPCHNAADSPPTTVFPWPPAQDDCFAGPDTGIVMETPGSTMNSRSTNGGDSGPGGAAPSVQPLDRWFDLGVSSQLVYSYDWYGSYNWDYLDDWTPEHHNLMQHVQEKSGY